MSAVSEETVRPVVAAKVLSVLRLDEYSMTDDEHDLVEVLIHDASRTAPVFTDEQLLEWARACRLTCSKAGLDQLRGLAAEADR